MRQKQIVSILCSIVEIKISGQYTCFYPCTSSPPPYQYCPHRIPAAPLLLVEIVIIQFDFHVLPNTRTILTKLFVHIIMQQLGTEVFRSHIDNIPLFKLIRQITLANRISQHASPVANKLRQIILTLTVSIARRQRRRTIAHASCSYCSTNMARKVSPTGNLESIHDQLRTGWVCPGRL